MHASFLSFDSDALFPFRTEADGETARHHLPVFSSRFRRITSASKPN